VHEVFVDYSQTTTFTSTPIFTSIFHEPWWLDAVTPGNWAEATVTSHGAVVARLPYCTKRFMGISGIGMPPLTHTMGPQLPLNSSNLSFRPSDHQELINELMGQLPRHAFFFQVCDPSMENAVPLYALGYDCSLTYTLRIDAAQSIEQTWKGMRSKTRRDIRNAEKRLSIDSDIGIDEFCYFYNANLRTNHNLRRSKAYEARASFVKLRLYEACRTHHAGCLLAARDEKGVLRAAIMLVWGHGVMYPQLGTYDAAPGGSHSKKLLVWEAVKMASQKKLTFDFDGFWRPEAVEMLTGFRGDVHNRISVTKMSPLLHFVREIKARSRFGV
jgi:Acetyltransferase (GNAT) domain